MKKLIEIREGDLIPDNARFIESRVERGPITHYSHRSRPYCIFWTHETTYAHYAPIRIYVYEVEEITAAQQASGKTE